MTTTELCDELVGVGSLGALDMVNVGPLAALPSRVRDRTPYEHSPEMALAPHEPYQEWQRP